MATGSAIEWTDATWNPLTGCTKVSRGCKHCYAETFAERFRGVSGHPYEQGFDLRLVPEKLGEPLRWLHVYSPPGEPFLCVEPVSHMPDALNRVEPRAVTGLRELAPGEMLSAHVTLSVSDTSQSD